MYMNVLLVDDEILVLRMLNRAVNWEKNGINKVFLARNVKEGQDILKREKVDIIVCDIEMPQGNGLDFIEWVSGIYPNIINIILSGHADFNYARNAISLGIYRFLLKPISFEEVEESISLAVKKISEYAAFDKVDLSEKKTMSADVVKMKEYLEKHYQESITRNNIEGYMHLSGDYMNRKFKKEIGYTLVEYIHYYRCNMAKNFYVMMI